MSRPPYTIDSFMARRVKAHANGCWVVQGAQHHHGYMRLFTQGRHHMAHRWVYEQLVGGIPEGLELDHLCRNTSCCNPKHLEPVTHEENQRRTRKAECSKGHALTPENLPLNPSKGRGTCRTCKRDYQREWMRSKYGYNPRRRAS